MKYRVWLDMCLGGSDEPTMGFLFFNEDEVWDFTQDVSKAKAFDFMSAHSAVQNWAVCDDVVLFEVKITDVETLAGREEWRTEQG